MRGENTSPGFADRLNGEFFLKKGGDDGTVSDDDAIDLLLGDDLGRD